MAFMGLPWPTNNTGILCDGDKTLPNADKADNVDIPVSCAAANKLPAFINVLLCILFKSKIKNRSDVQIYMYIHSK